MNFNKHIGSLAEDWTKRIKLYHIKVAGCVNRYLADKKDSFIVDCGCGVGCIGKILLDSGYKNFFGFDISAKKINKCRMLGINAAVGSIDNIPFESSKADCVICSEVLEHLEENVYEKAIDEIKRILKPSSYLIITFPTSGLTKWHIREISLSEIKEKFSEYNPIEIRETYGRLYSREEGKSSIFILFEKKYLEK